jgi:hypothetical protein
VIEAADDDAVPASLAAARRSLDVACEHLDAAVYALVDVPDDDDVMGSPALVALLLSVVMARRQVRSLELSMTLNQAEPWSPRPVM